MQNHKILQIKNYYSLIFIILISSISCHQRVTNEGLNKSSNIESDKTSIIPIKKSKPIGKPAVMYRSIDMGMTWSSFANGIPEEATVSGIKQFGEKIYISTDYHGIFVTSDNQDNWISLKSEYLKNIDINCIEVNDNRLIIGTFKNGILVSDDGGLNWRPSNKGLNTSPIRAFIRSENKLYVGTDSGIFGSDDMGDSWSHIFGQMQILGFTSLNNKLYAATQNGVLMCDGNSKDWKSIYEGDALHDVGNDGKYIYAMTIGQQLLKTQNDGALWENAQNGIIRPANYYTNELQHIGNNIFSAQWIGVYHSSDNGDNWKILDGLPDSIAFSTLEITDFGIIAGISIR